MRAARHPADASLGWSGVRRGTGHGARLASAALTLRADQAPHLIFNAYWEPLDFELPSPDVDVDAWRRIVDTGLDAPDDIVPDFTEAVEVSAGSYRAEARSVVLLAARRAEVTASRRSTR
jgi:glycogen operon protein